MDTINTLYTRRDENIEKAYQLTSAGLGVD